MHKPTLKELQYRKTILKNGEKDNSAIIKKLERQIRKLSNK